MCLSTVVSQGWRVVQGRQETIPQAHPATGVHSVIFFCVLGCWPHVHAAAGSQAPHPTFQPM